MPIFKVKVTMKGYESAPVSETAEFKDENAIMAFYSKQGCEVVGIELVDGQTVAPVSSPTNNVQPNVQQNPQTEQINEYFEFTDNNKKYRVNLKTKEAEINGIYEVEDFTEVENYYIISGLNPISLKNYLESNKVVLGKLGWKKVQK